MKLKKITIIYWLSLYSAQFFKIFWEKKFFF